jgi:hypothetical protein
MLFYPKIPGSRHAPDGRCIAFEKYDGTNLHWEWDRDFGWHSVGTRRDEFPLIAGGIELFVEKHAHLRQSVEVFAATLADGIEKVFRDSANYRELQAFKVFAEFLGPNSFAGLHKTDDVKELRLFDVQVDPHGMIGPHQFMTDFGHLHSARVVYQGKLTGAFAEDVRQGKYGVNEGVVCKGGVSGADVWMVKIKTYAYMERLKQAFADRWEDYWE